MSKKCEQKFGVDTGDPRHGCFAMVFNSIIVELELLIFYEKIWGQTYFGTPEIFARHRNENAERVIHITKLTFIDIVSAIEFSMKNTLEKLNINQLSEWYRERLNGNSRTYLSTIIEKSKRLGKISETEATDWNCLLELRNSLVHNNGIADRNYDCPINGVTVKFEKGKMIQGNLNFFPKMVDKIIDLYWSWLLRTN